MPEKKKRGNGEGGLYVDGRGFWTGVVELPPKDGKRRRKVIRSKSRKTVLDGVRSLQNELETRGDLPTADMTVEGWFLYWLENIVPREVKPKAAAGYRSVTRRHIIPAIGGIQLSKVQPTHLRRVEERIVDECGLSPTYALNAHRVMSTAFEHAVRDNRIGRNPAKVMAAPRKRNPRLEAFTLDEAVDVLRQISADQDYGARWAMALLTGARRGEVLGLEVDRVGGRHDLLDLSWQLQRLTWEHGCGPSMELDGKTVWPCRAGQGNTCPERRLRMPHDYEVRQLTNGLYLTRPKSKSGTRVVPLVEPLRSIIHRHIERNVPGGEGLVFPWKGRPADPDQDTARWGEVLARTGIDKHVRLHDLRHTAIDLMSLADVPDDVIMQIVGHADRATTNAYRSRNVSRLRKAMEQMSALYLEPPPAA